MGGDHLWDALGAIGEIVGALAVVATLGYLAIQVKQSNRLARSNAVLTLQAENRAHRDSLAHDPQLADIVNRGIQGRDLTELELFQYRARNDASLAFFESMYLQYEAGIITEEDFMRYTPVLKNIVRTSNELGIEINATTASFGNFLARLSTKDAPDNVE